MTTKLPFFKDINYSNIDDLVAHYMDPLDYESADEHINCIKEEINSYQNAYKQKKIRLSENYYLYLKEGLENLINENDEKRIFSLMTKANRESFI